MISKALVINDDQTSLMITTMFLSRSGFSNETFTATDGELGLSFYESFPHGKGAVINPPEFIFLDLSMPVMSGWDFLERFSNEYARLFPEVRVVIMSAYVAPEERQRLSKYDVILDYISTPLSIDMLVDIKQKYLNLKNARFTDTAYSC